MFSRELGLRSEVDCRTSRQRFLLRTRNRKAGPVLIAQDPL